MTDSVLIAHRGLEDTHPENTLPAFEAALDLGMGIEFDLAMTADGHVVVIHDETVDRTTDGSGRVSQMSLDELRELDAGDWKGEQFAGAKVPTLDEVLGLVSAKASISPAVALDVKILPPGIINAVCDTLDRHGVMDRTIGTGLVARSVDVRRRFYEGSAEFRCSAIAETLPLVLSDPYSSWVYARFVPSNADVAAVHEAGKKIFVSGPVVTDSIEETIRAAGSGADAVMAANPAEVYRRLNG